MRFFQLLSADKKRFHDVHGAGIAPLFYYPMFTAIVMYRLCCVCNRYWYFRPIAYLLVRLNDLLHGVWIGPNVVAGPGLFLGHARGLIVNPATKIGKNVSIMQRVTLGGPGIEIGNNVELNAGSSILAPKNGAGIRIGDGAVIGACSVVTKDVAPGAVVVGNPGRVIRIVVQ